MYTPSLVKLGRFSSDEDPLKSLAFTPSEVENHYYCLSGGLGETLQVHLVSFGQKGVTSQLISSNKNQGSIGSVEVSPGSDGHLASGGDEGILSIWQIPADFSSGIHNESKGKKKKAALNNCVLPKLTEYKVHNGTIQSLNWINNQEVVSSSSCH